MTIYFYESNYMYMDAYRLYQSTIKKHPDFLEVKKAFELFKTKNLI